MDNTGTQIRRFKINEATFLSVNKRTWWLEVDGVKKPVADAPPDWELPKYDLRVMALNIWKSLKVTTTADPLAAPATILPPVEKVDLDITVRQRNRPPKDSGIKRGNQRTTIEVNHLYKKLGEETYEERRERSERNERLDKDACTGELKTGVPNTIGGLIAQELNQRITKQDAIKKVRHQAISDQISAILAGLK